jgi:acyl-CoA thioesterase FadM
MTTQLTLDRNDSTIAEGELRHVFVETGGGKTAPIPEAIRSGLARYSSEPI